MEHQITVIVVEHKNEQLVETNLRLILDLNPELAPRLKFLVVNNDQSSTLEESLSGVPNLSIIEGTLDSVGIDSGSYHHAEGLTLGVKALDTRFVLIIDPDFYIVRRNGLSDLLDALQTNDLSCIASTWNPRWIHQPRDVPTIHMMLLDCSKLDPKSIDLSPVITHPFRYSGPAKNLVQRIFRGKFRDTAFRLVRRLTDGSHRMEVLTPSFRPEKFHPRWSLDIDRIVPDRFALTPKAPSSFTRKSFLEECAPSLYSEEIEEFYWRAEPFAIHLRQIGRRLLEEEERSKDSALLDSSLKSLVEVLNDRG